MESQLGERIVIFHIVNPMNWIRINSLIGYNNEILNGVE